MSPTREPFSKEDAELALAVLLEPLAQDARVLWLGEPGAAAERISTTARSIEAVAPEAATRRGRAARKPTTSIRTRAFPGAGEVFDLIVALDVDEEARIAELARHVETGGILAIAVEASSPQSYGRLHQEVARHFARVRMLGQTRFAGFAHVDFARTAGLEVAFDGSALETTETPVRWIAIGGGESRGLEPYLVVQTPSLSQAAVSERTEKPAVERGGLEREIDAARARLEHSESRLEQAQREIARNAQKLDELRHQLEQAQAGLRAKEGELETARRALAQSQKKPEGASPAELREMEEAYDELEGRLKMQGTELSAMRVELERRATLVRDLVEELAEARKLSPGSSSSAPLGAGPAAEASSLPELDRVRAQLAGLVRKLADAESERAAAVFRADELGASLARARREAGEPTSGEASAAPAAETEARVRTLTAAMAGLEERRSQAEARRTILEDDLRLARERTRQLEQEVAQVREELAMARMRPPPDSDHGARREGELMGSLHRAREALLAAQDERDHLVREHSHLRAKAIHAEQEATSAREAAVRDVASSRSEVELLRAGEAAARSALIELRSAHETRLAALDALEGERAGLSMRLDDAEAALETARARLSAAEAERGSLNGLSEALRAEIVVLRRERDGLAQRVDAARVLREKLAGAAGSGSTDTIEDGDALDLEQQLKILDREREEARKIGILLGDVERDLESIRRERESESVRAREAEAALSRHLEDDQAKAAAWVQRIGSRDALVARLQTQLASMETDRAARQVEVRALEEKLFREAEARAALEAVQSVQRSEDVRERAGLAEEVSQARADSSTHRERATAARTLLDQLRGELGRLVEGIRAPAPGAPEAVLRDEVSALSRELEDRGLMLRSLTAQLEERDERLRNLEVGGANQVIQGLEGRLREAEEKEARLLRELELAAERRAAAMEREAELRRLEQLLERREAELMTNEGQLEQSQRAQAGLRDQVARLGSELESVLGRAATDPPSVLVERLGEILRALRR